MIDPEAPDTDTWENERRRPGPTRAHAVARHRR
jgi:hypothetical protein